MLFRSHKDDYQRYSTIVREQTGSPKVDYSKLNNVWVHPNAAAAGQQSGDPQLLTQALLSTVVFGNLNAKDRHSLTNLIQSHVVYKVDFDHAKNTKFEGHSVMSYAVAIKLEGLASALKQYGLLTGFKAAQNLNPSSFADRPDIELTMIVDIRNHELRAVNYKNTVATERYYNFGQTTEFKIPAKSVNQKTFEELLNGIEKTATPAAAVPATAADSTTSTTQ